MKLPGIATPAVDHQALEGNDDPDSDEIGTLLSSIEMPPAPYSYIALENGLVYQTVG